ncbi:MAP kinase-activating death domain protein-like isoform X2 [Actinia tenebrosa]|uniref:MAP kinase-activating death domain protein n=1 Tax=Actinia tenebrosa TaxID=6105 RepID=A0A6P8IE72_ACTTE|nr:MAP kinase-activating death domain protein-like isoform X2 [Actinia tenebrosa]
MAKNKKFPHTRLMDYVIVVGVRKPTLDSTETPQLLRRFPQKDHEDSCLPPDVVFFCQPEGCSTVSKKFSLREANSFIFTLTDKDTNKVRYGVCMNIYRPCSEFLFKENLETKLKEPNITKRKRSRSRNKKDICMTQTSICIVSHHPFFSTFRECLFVLRKMIDSRVGKTSNDKNENTIPGLESWSVFTCTEDPKLSALAEEMAEIETWIHRLLLAPAPMQGRTKVNMELLCPETYPSLLFSSPENSRLPLIDFPVHIPLELLGVETCLKVLTCILLEQKVVIQSRDYNALTMTVLALTALVYPLQYMFPIIPLLPSCMNNAEQLLMAPTPYVIGVPASFFRYKCNGFVAPNDIWIVDLDSNKLTVPLSADELPDLPEDVGPMLVKQLKMALQALSMPPQSISSMNKAAPHDRIPQVIKDNNKPTENSPTENLVFGNDVDAVDIAVRVALVNFFLSDDILGGVHEHVRTLRLYPRPVVALQKGPFLKSRPKQSDFVLALSETQAVEYFGEWFICPTNTAFQKIQKGIYDPQMIGDKAKWYFNDLETVHYQVYDVDSKLYGDPWIEVDYEPSLIFDEEEDTPNNEDDDDSSSCYSSVSDLVQQMISGDINGKTPIGSQNPPFNPVRSSSPLPDVQASFSLPDALTTGPFGQFLGLQSGKERQTSDSDTIIKSGSETTTSGDSATGSIESESYSVPDDDSDGLIYSVSNPPSPESERKKFPASDTDDSEKTSASDQESSQVSTVVSKSEKSSTPTEPVSVMGFLNSLKKTTINVAKMATQDQDEKVNPDGYMKRTSSQTSLQSLSSKPSMVSDEKSFFPFPGVRQRNGSTDKILGRPSLSKQASMEKAAHSDNQQFLKEILRNVLRGDGMGWLTNKRFKRLMIEENYRLIVVNQLFTAPVATEEEAEVMEDVQLSYDKSLTLAANLNNNAKALESLQQKIPALQWNLSSLSFGTWLSPTTTATAAAPPMGTGTDSTQSPTPGAKRISRNVYKGILEVMRYMISGFEVTVSNHGIGGVASAYKFLEVAHTHYYGRDIKEEAVKRRSDDELSIASNCESISSLSDQLSEISSSEIEKRRFNGESDRDSGHGGSEFDAIMLPVAKHDKLSKTVSCPRWNSDLTNSSTHNKSKARLKESAKLVRTYSADQPSKTTRQREVELRKEKSKSPTLAHMKLSGEGSSSRRSSYDRMSLSSVNIPPSPMLRKSNLSKGYRYYNGDLFPIDNEPDKPTTGRRYLFESLLHERSALWDNMDFWENIFLDAVAGEREAIGMAQGTIEMIERHKSLQKQEQKRLEEDEDRVLATILYNLVAFMIALDVDKTAIKKKIRRLIGKAHIGLMQGQPINDLLDNIENLNGNDVDLKPTESRQIKKQSFVVHSGSTMNGDVFFMEVSDDCILLRTGAGVIVERWWYEKMVNITYCSKTKVICLWYRKGEDTLLSKFCTKKCKALYYCMKESMQRAAERVQATNKGPQLGGSFPIQDMETNEKGQLQVTLEGIGLKFATKRIHIDLCHIRNCSTQKGVFVLDEFVPATQQTVDHRFKSEKCNEICYAVLCLFSYVAASRNTDSNSGATNKAR